MLFKYILKKEKTVEQTSACAVRRIKYVTVIATVSVELHYDPRSFARVQHETLLGQRLRVSVLCQVKHSSVSASASIEPELDCSAVYDKEGGKKKGCHEIYVIENTKSQLEGQSHVCVTQKPVSLCQRLSVCRNCNYLIPSKTFCD